MAEHPMDMDEPSQEMEPDQKDKEKIVEFYLEAFEMEIRGLLSDADVKKLILSYEKFDTDEKRRLSQYAEKKTPLKIFDEIIKSIRNIKNEHLKYIALAEAFKKMDHEKVHLILTGEAIPTNDTHRQLIYHCGVDICQMMVVDQILPVLVMAGVVCEEDRQAIQSKHDMKGNWDAAFQLLNCLSNKKVEWYPSFITILLKHQHQDLAKLINHELKKMRDDGKDTTVSMSGVAPSTSSCDMHDEHSSVVEHVMTDYQDTEPMDDLDAPPPVPPGFDSFHKTENGTISEKKDFNLKEEENTVETNKKLQDSSELILKDYQLELAENAVAGHNTVICAGTGTGKTWVALHVVKEQLKRACQGKRKEVFMARTSSLIKQQAERLNKYLPPFQMLSLEEALQKEHNTNVDVAVIVLEVGDLVTYTNKANQQMSYYSIVIADHSTFELVRLYNTRLMNKLVNGSCVLLRGILRNTTGAHSFWIVSSSTAINLSTVEIPEALVLASKPQNTDEVTPLARAVISHSTSKVNAQIMQTSPLKYRKNGVLPIKYLRLQDHEDGPSVNLTLFGDHATREYKAGDVVSISDTYKDTYKGKQSRNLSTMKSTKVKFLRSDLFNIPTDGVPLCEHSDFKEDSVSSNETEQFTVISVSAAHVFKCCPNNECWNKKLEGDTCPTCKSSCLTREAWYCNATVKVQRGDSQLQEYNIFKDNLDKIFILPNLKTSDLSSFKQSLSDQLPANGRAVFKNGRMKILSTKRRLLEL